MIEKLKGYSFIGLRTPTDDENYSIGNTCRNSYEWDYENDCSTFDTENPIELNGTCSMEITIDGDTTEEDLSEMINNFKGKYCGEQVIIIGGYEAEYGSDENEIIISNATVLEVI